MAVLRNVEVMWASVQEPNEMSGKYQVDLVNLTPEQVKGFEAENCEVHTCDRDENNRGKYITLKSTRKVPVVDLNKAAFDDLIGNGSICNVIWQPFEWSFKKKSGTSAGLQKIQVVELVAYAGSGEDFDDVDGDDDEIPF